MAYYGTTTSMTVILTHGTEATLELCDNDYIPTKYMNELPRPFKCISLVHFPYSITRKTTLHALKQHYILLRKVVMSLPSDSLHRARQSEIHVHKSLAYLG